MGTVLFEIILSQIVDIHPIHWNIFEDSNDFH